MREKGIMSQRLSSVRGKNIGRAEPEIEPATTCSRILYVKVNNARSVKNVATNNKNEIQNATNAQLPTLLQQKALKVREQNRDLRLSISRPCIFGG